MLRICFSLCASYRRAFVYRRLSRSIIVIQAIHAHLRCGRLSCGGQGAVLKPGRWRQEEVGEGQLIRKILLLIRAITQCHNYQCHQLVCNYFFFFFFCCIPGQTDALCASVCVCVCVCSLPPPHYLTHSQLLYLIGYMQIGPKLKATCEGTPHGTVLYTHPHWRANLTV